MANKYIKGYSASRHQGKKQIMTTTNLSEQQKSKILTTPNAGEDVEQQELFSLLVGMQHGAATLKECLAISYNTTHTLTICNLAIVLLCAYPKERKTYIHTKTCTQMFTAALFIIAKTWKQQRFPFNG